MTEDTARSNQEPDSVTGPAYMDWPNRETAAVYRHLAGDVVDVKHCTDTAARHLADMSRTDAARRTGEDIHRYAHGLMTDAVIRSAHPAADLVRSLSTTALSRVSWTTLGLAFVWRAEQGMDDPEPDDTW